MIINYSNLSFDNKPKHDSDNNQQEIFKIITLNEFIRKDLLIISKKYVDEFSKQDVFNKNIPIAYTDFIEFLHRDYSLKEELMLDQFIFNLQLLSIKIYNLFENKKKKIENIKDLRLTFAHKKSGRILSNNNRVVICGGLSWDLNYFDIVNIGYREDGVKNKIIPYEYVKYVECMIKRFDHDLVNNIKQLRELNNELLKEITFIIYNN